MTLQRWMIYGATGYTGGLLAELAVERGARPILAGRDDQALRRLSDRLGLPFRAFGLEHPEALAAALADIDLVMHCAGPFSATGAPMAEACIAAGTHYLDITGEIPVFEYLKSLDGPAGSAGVMLLPGVGFDVLPSETLAVELAAVLPDATHLELAFCGDGGASPGTLKTMVEMLGEGGRIRRDGEIVRVPAGFRRRAITFGDGRRRWCMSIPWGDISTAYTATGIPHITVFTAVPRVAAMAARLCSPLLGLLSWPGLQRPLKRWLGRRVSGPDATARRDGRVLLWGEVVNDLGERRQAMVQIPEGYQFTVEACYQSVQRVLAGDVRPGYRTPTAVFGVGFLHTLPGCRRQGGEGLALLDAASLPG